MRSPLKRSALFPQVPESIHDRISVPDNSSRLNSGSAVHSWIVIHCAVAGYNGRWCSVQKRKPTGISRYAGYCGSSPGALCKKTGDNSDRGRRKRFNLPNRDLARIGIFLSFSFEKRIPLHYSAGLMPGFFKGQQRGVSQIPPIQPRFPQKPPPNNEHPAGFVHSVNKFL